MGSVVYFCSSRTCFNQTKIDSRVTSSNSNAAGCQLVNLPNLSFSSPASWQEPPKSARLVREKEAFKTLNDLGGVVEIGDIILRWNLINCVRRQSTA